MNYDYCRGFLRKTLRWLTRRQVTRPGAGAQLVVGQGESGGSIYVLPRLLLAHTRDSPNLTLIILPGIPLLCSPP